MTAEITLLTKHGIDPLMSKRVFLDDEGNPKSDGSGCYMAHGAATRRAAASAGALAQIIAECDSNQAIALGSLAAGLPDPATIVSKQRLKDNPGAISRSRDFIDYRAGEPGWALIDFDLKGMPTHVLAAIGARGGMWNALLAVAPGLARAARVSRASTSAGLLRTDTGQRFAGSGGAHHYLLVTDAGDIERFLRDLHELCWLNGFGWYVIGGAGQLLERSLVDRMVGYGERVCFEGAPVIEPPLTQDPAQRVPVAVDGEAIDPLIVVPRLTEYHRHRVEEAKKASAEALGKQAAEVRSRHDRTLAESLSAKFGMPLVSALRLVAARHRGVLLPYIELDFDELGVVTVAEVLADPDRFIGGTLADPMEGASYGRCKALVMRGDDGHPFIHSFAHGHSFYHLRHDARSAIAAVAHAPAGAEVDHAMAILAVADLEPDDLNEFAGAAAKAAGKGVRAVMARINKERKEREKAEQKAAAASSADGRIVRPRPEYDGELTPVVSFVDQVLAADQREEPPMRDAGGHLVEVRVREPWSLHLLTSDGANDGGDDADATVKAPAEPVLVQLTPIDTELLIERYIRWRKVTKTKAYYAALPRPFIEALMRLPASNIPVARAINTSPLVALSGEVIEGVGLDRGTGLVHRIDPLLRACLPAEPPTEEEVRKAMNFLLNEWLVDVALDPVGKVIAIMLAMTLIERALLPERPAFFVTAGLRGGGKTTLVNMLVQAALGRRAAAAGWSDNAEERKKALFSYLRQGVACIAWDNIARGLAISCSHIEAALTASEISDRVLGVSRVETAPSTTVHIFTGNSITPRGDMASRSLMLALNVNRPDPENRVFTHADPLAWTQANRLKIVRALYLLLIAGALARPPSQEAKTRFKTWWSLVGWPAEYAAGLIGVNVDCTALMRAGEVGDEEASAASAALTVLHDIWGDRKFTTKEVVQAMTVDAPFGAWSTKSNNEKARAETLADALGELVGKRLDRPIAHSLGKLFQKRLVGRPAWIGDGQMVAVLRKYTGHDENSYRVEVSTAATSAEAPSDNGSTAADPGRKHSPDSPESRHAGGADAGNAGKDGNVSPAGAAGDDAFSEKADGSAAWQDLI
jgi:hypothetical protein